MGAIGTYIECRVPISSPTLLENSSNIKQQLSSTDVPLLLINFVLCLRFKNCVVHVMHKLPLKRFVIILQNMKFLYKPLRRYNRH